MRSLVPFDQKQLKELVALVDAAFDSFLDKRPFHPNKAGVSSICASGPGTCSDTNCEVLPSPIALREYRRDGVGSGGRDCKRVDEKRQDPVGHQQFVVSVKRRPTRCGALSFGYELLICTRCAGIELGEGGEHIQRPLDRCAGLAIMCAIWRNAGVDDAGPPSLGRNNSDAKAGKRPCCHFVVERDRIKN